MKINNRHYKTIWIKKEAPEQVQIIDQRSLPHALTIETLKHADEAARAIREMHVRGAPLIGVTAAYGLYLSCLHAPNGKAGLQKIEADAELLRQTRPTAVNLFRDVDLTLEVIRKEKDQQGRVKAALAKAEELAAESIVQCRSIGSFGLELIEEVHRSKEGEPINILTHCNAGWLACIDYGTATAPIYLAHDKGIPVHVWVDETRPRNQGARITAFELLQHGVPHTVITDNAGGLLMQKGMVDMVMVGTDRTTRGGDVANKIGTYLKALAAHDNGVPFYVAAPSSSIDWSIKEGLREIEIEQRSEEEVKYIQGLTTKKKVETVLLCPSDSPAVNYGFDITPARYVTALVTERGLCAANESSLLDLFPEHRSFA